ncbi:unnamed protein product [Aphanomyces euteiches]
MEFTPQYNDKRREAARKGMSKLRAARKREVEALMAQIENLEGVLGHLKAHPEERHRGINQFVVTRRILDQRNSALKAQVLACNRLIQLLRSWTISRQLPKVVDACSVNGQVVEKVGDHIVYVKQEHVDLNYRRLCLAAVFLDHEKDRITITQTGIAMDDRFPFQGGESRSNGFQWYV